MADSANRGRLHKYSGCQIPGSQLLGRQPNACCRNATVRRATDKGRRFRICTCLGVQRSTATPAQAAGQQDVNGAVSIFPLRPLYLSGTAFTDFLPAGRAWSLVCLL